MAPSRSKWCALDKGEISTGTNHLGFRCVKLATATNLSASRQGNEE